MAAMRFVALVLCTVFAVLGDSAIAAPPAEAPAAGSVSAHAAPAQVAPVVDGSVLDDKAWDGAKVISGFWQTTPDEGQPASENTEVRVLFTATALYIGVVNYDRTPELIISSESRRDASLTNTDSFLVILDTFRDRQNGYVFGNIPAGIENEGLVSSTSTGMGPGRLNRKCSRAAGARSSRFHSGRFAIPRPTCRSGESTFSETSGAGTRRRTGRPSRASTT